MKLRRDVLIAVLATFCLTSALFTIKPSGSQSTLSYNPWMDINDDGRIDIYDVVSVTAIYGKTGNPLKPVMVNGYYAEEWNRTYELSQGKSNVTWIPTKGLRKITLQISIWPGVWIFASDGSQFGYANATIYIERQILNQTICSETVFLDAKITISKVPPIPIIVGTIHTQREFDIAFSSIKITVYARSTIRVTELYYVTA
jgi:hypothetical protein